MEEKQTPKGEKGKAEKRALNIQIDASDYDYLVNEAEDRGVSLAGFVRMIIKEKRKSGKTDI